MTEASTVTREPDHDELAEQFFSQPPQAWEVALDDWQPRPLSAGERRAMHTTFGLLVVGTAAALAFVVFPDMFLVLPAPVGEASGRAASTLAQRDLVGAELKQHGVAALAKADAHVVEPSKVATAQPASADGPQAPSAIPQPVAPALVAAETAVPAVQPTAATAAPVEPVAAPAIVAAVPVPASDLQERTPALRHQRTASRDGALPALRGGKASERRSPAQALITSGRRALNTGDAGHARVLAERAIASDPGAASAYILLAGALDALGDRAGMQVALRNCTQRAQDSLVSACRSLAR